MSNRVSAIGADYKQGTFGNLIEGANVHLRETHFDFMGELAAFPEALMSTQATLSSISSQSHELTAFKIARNRWFLTCPSSIAPIIRQSTKPEHASLIDLSHARTSITIAGPKSEWVLSKLYAIDFVSSEFPTGTGLATAHHGIFTHIYRRGDQTFDLFVPRSFARSYWHTLTRAALNVGYEVG